VQIISLSNYMNVLYIIDNKVGNKIYNDNNSVMDNLEMIIRYKKEDC